MFAVGGYGEPEGPPACTKLDGTWDRGSATGVEDCRDLDIEYECKELDTGIVNAFASSELELVGCCCWNSWGSNALSHEDELGYPY